jgi:putative protease
MKKNIELLAPAGSEAALSAAIKGGADAIYFGVGHLNMRCRAASNFQIEDIHKVVRKCNYCNVKSYLVLNTVVYDDELNEIKEICDLAKKEGVTAVIASDIGVIKYAYDIGLNVHISVQANISNLDSVKFHSQFANVMILARELNLNQVRYIIEQIKEQHITGPSGELIRIELFAHGALCVSVSGKCYMSLGTYNMSANRGACLQNCRRKYRIIDDDTGEELIIDNKYVMSPKDICTVNIIDQLIDAGVSIFKLEGRGRESNYVREVTATYREAIDATLNGTFSQENVKRWVERLSQVFNRGFWMGGYYMGEALGEWAATDGNIAPTKKQEVAKVLRYFPKIKVAELQVMTKTPLTIGDTILFTGKLTGALKQVVPEMRNDAGEKITKIVQGEIISMRVKEKVRKGDVLYKLVNRQFGDL